MKHAVLLLGLSVLLSCEKKITITCTCRDSNGTIVSQSAKSTHDKDKVEELKQQCREQTYYGNGTSMPCEPG